MFEKVLIANRGEIARRIIRTARRMGIRSVAVFSDADRGAAHVAEADEAIHIGPSPAAASYLDGAAIVRAALASGAEAIHPGYGFLSERADFAEAVIGAGLRWIGPAPATIRALGDKAEARARMAAAGVPVNPGGAVETPNEALALAERAGFPVIVKPSAGGGGIGMRIVRNSAELAPACERARDQAERFFGAGGLLIEHYLESARHVEIQILGLADGRIIVLGERDCSIQRRYQKVVEETPCPVLGEALRQRMFAAARTGAASLDYRGAGTIECLVAGEAFVFLEVNARLQVEHPVTELVYGIDLVEAQFRIACGEEMAFDVDRLAPAGHAIELRVYAEDPVRFMPGGGLIERWDEPAGVGIRVDAGYRQGDTVSTFYDPLLAKLCAWGGDRDEALARARAAIDRFAIVGPRHNLPFLARVLDDPGFRQGVYDTGFVANLPARLAA